MLPNSLTLEMIFGYKFGNDGIHGIFFTKKILPSSLEMPLSTYFFSEKGELFKRMSEKHHIEDSILISHYYLHEYLLTVGPIHIHPVNSLTKSREPKTC